MDYSEQLQDPRWQRKRLEIFQRDNFKCSTCGNEQEQLEVHHRYYVSGRVKWDYPNASLVTLCRTCHSAKRSEEEPVFRSEYIKGFSYWEEVAALVMDELNHGGNTFALAVARLCGVVKEDGGSDLVTARMLAHGINAMFIRDGDTFTPEPATTG